MSLLAPIRCVPACPVPSKAQRKRQVYLASSASVCTEVSNVPEIPQEKQQWQSSVRRLQKRQKHRLWEPVLTDPPPLLDNVCVILVAPKRPISVGTVARSCSCFEVQDLRIVAPQCDHLARSGRNASKGAQYLLWRSQEHSTLESALADAEFSVACTRWVAGRANAFRGVNDLLAAPQLTKLLYATSNVAGMSLPATASLNSITDHCGSGPAGMEVPLDQQLQQQPARKKLAFVFGREVSGLTQQEIDMCDASLSIPIGRLQESMSLSHAVSVVLSRLFEQRQEALGHLLPESVADLATGWQETGTER